MNRPLLFILLLLVAGCSKWKTNEDYLNYLASLVIQYQNKHGAVPESFDQAHSESGVVLPNRGDKYGRGLAYVDFQPDAFMFRSYGENNQNDLGFGDDLDIYYIAGKKVPREALIAYLKSKKDSYYWDIYGSWFQKE